MAKTPFPLNNQPGQRNPAEEGFANLIRTDVRSIGPIWRRSHTPMPIGMKMRLSLLNRDALLLKANPCGSAQLVIDGQHFQQIVEQGLLKAQVSIDVMTADFKAMLVPD